MGCKSSFHSNKQKAKQTENSNSSLISQKTEFTRPTVVPKIGHKQADLENHNLGRQKPLRETVMGR